MLKSLARHSTPLAFAASHSVEAAEYKCLPLQMSYWWKFVLNVLIKSFSGAFPRKIDLLNAGAIEIIERQWEGKLKISI